MYACSGTCIISFFHLNQLFYLQLPLWHKGKKEHAFFKSIKIFRSIISSFLQYFSPPFVKTDYHRGIKLGLPSKMDFHRIIDMLVIDSYWLWQLVIVFAIQDIFKEILVKTKHMLNISPGKTFLHLSLDKFHHKAREHTRCCIYLAASSWPVYLRRYCTVIMFLSSLSLLTKAVNPAWQLQQNEVSPRGGPARWHTKRCYVLIIMYKVK